MIECIISGQGIAPDARCIAVETEAGSATAHNECILKLRAVLGIANVSPKNLDDSTYPFVNRIGDDWILNRRDISISMIILAYLNAQNEPRGVKSLYEWLRRNEIASSNPAEYVKELRNKGQIAVMKSDKSRLIQITDKGRNDLISFSKKLKNPSKM